MQVCAASSSATTDTVKSQQTSCIGLEGLPYYTSPWFLRIRDCARVPVSLHSPRAGLECCICAVSLKRGSRCFHEREKREAPAKQDKKLPHTTVTLKIKRPFRVRGKQAYLRSIRIATLEALIQAKGQQVFQLETKTRGTCEREQGHNDIHKRKVFLLEQVIEQWCQF